LPTLFFYNLRSSCRLENPQSLVNIFLGAANQHLNAKAREHPRHISSILIEEVAPVRKAHPRKRTRKPK